MTKNQKHLKEAQTRAKEFEAELEPERLREAYMALENVILVQEDDLNTRAQLRTNSLSLWLHLIQLVDRFLDPKFNPEDVPEEGVLAPPTTGGVVYPPGADPALIDDPKARAEYEKAIAANQAEAIHYRLQTHLRRLDARITPRAEAFIKGSFTPASTDQQEVKAAVEKIVKNPKRKARLLKLLTPRSKGG